MKKNVLKETVDVISSDTSFIAWHLRFATLPFKPLSELFLFFYFKIDYLIKGFSSKLLAD